MAENESSRDLGTSKDLGKKEQGLQGKTTNDDLTNVGTVQETIKFNETEPGKRSREEIGRPQGTPDEDMPTDDAGY